MSLQEMIQAFNMSVQYSQAASSAALLHCLSVPKDEQGHAYAGRPRGAGNFSF